MGCGSDAGEQEGGDGGGGGKGLVVVERVTGGSVGLAELSDMLRTKQSGVRQ